MYHADFRDARNWANKLYRDPKSGDLLEHCCHNYIISPQWRHETELHAEFIPQDKKMFDGFECICVNCGDVLFILPDNVVTKKEQEKRIDERIEEFKEEKTKQSKKKL